MPGLSFLLADDHEIVRTGVKMVLQQQYPKATFDEASNGDELFRALQQRDYSLIIMDVSMPNSDALTVVEAILKLKPHLKILVFSVNPEEIYSVRFIRQGCYGYISKTHQIDELLKGVDFILTKGQKYLTTNLMLALTDSFLNTGFTQNPFTALSTRELQVVQLLLAGRSTSDIAESLCLHASTVATHKSRAMEKLNAKSITQLIKLAELYNLSDVK